MELSRFCDLHLRDRWQPGRVDCMLALADWAVVCGYDDPAVDLRGSYDDEAGYQAIVEAAGGAVAIVRGGAARLGLMALCDPVHGCAAVVGSPNNPQRQWGGIWDDRSGGWRVRFADSYPSVRAHALTMWAL